MKISVNAYAKINLFLDIESIQENGYHNIISYMQSVSLHDTVSVELIDDISKKISVTCDNDVIPCNESNLCYKAAAGFPSFTVGKLQIHITKRIPVCAGLAGGSADAAATLVALNQLFGNPYSMEELKGLGKTLGADVPFCIELGSCIATGVGEILSPTVSMPRYPILIAKHGEGMSTPQAYRELDVKFNKFKNYHPNTDRLKLLTGNKCPSIEVYSLGLFNIFEEVVEPHRPYVTTIKKIMNDNGAVASMMSGSGTSVFGIFKSEFDATSVQKILNSLGIESHLCYPYSPEKKQAILREKNSLNHM